MFDFISKRKKRARLWWVERLFSYFKDHQSVRFETSMQSALETFFSSDHESVEPFTDKQKLADSRFYDFFLFEYKSPSFNRKTVMEYFYKNAQLGQDEKKYVKRLIKENIYSFFRVKEHYSEKGWLLEDLLTGKLYNVLEKMGTRGTQLGDVIIFRLIPHLDESSESWMMAPGDPLMISMQQALPLVNGLKRLQKDVHGKKGKLDALFLEKSMFSKKGVSSIDHAEAIDCIDAEEKLGQFLKKHQSSYSPEKIREVIQGDDEQVNLRLSFQIIKSFKKKPSKKKLDELVMLLNAFTNHIPRDSLGGKTPLEMKESHPQGPLEESIKSDFFQACMSFFSARDYPTNRTIEHVKNKFQKAWLHFPQEALEGKTPMQAILEERRGLGNEDEAFGLGYACNIDELPEYRLQPFEEIDVVENKIAEDISTLLDYVNAQVDKGMVWEGKRWKAHQKKLLKQLKGVLPKVFLNYGKPLNQQKAYLDFLLGLCLASKLLKERWVRFELHKTNYKKFIKKSDSKKLIDLFCNWFFGKKEYYEHFIFEHMDIESVHDMVDHFREKRETLLANIFKVAEEGSCDYEAFFYLFYGSKREILENNKLQKALLMDILLYVQMMHFHVFGLVDLGEKTDQKGHPEKVKVTVLGKQIMPYVLDELYHRDLDQGSLSGDIQNFLELHNSAGFEGGAWEAPVQSIPKIGRNEPCFCGSGKKYKKCCLD